MKKILSLLIIVAGLYTIGSAQAATEPRVYLQRDGGFGLKVLIDSEEPVNAYNIQITYDKKIIDIESIDTSRSIITIVPQPIRAKDGVIVIKGGSTVPFSGLGGELASVMLKPVATGVETFTVTSASAYRADGSGAAVALASSPLSIRVTEGSFSAYGSARTAFALAPVDAAPPKILATQIEKDPLSEQQKLLVFAATDGESGVARYEAREREWVSWSNWREAVNPYPIESGAWAVQLKAVDNGGNESLATVYQMGAAAQKLGISVALLLAAYGAFRLIRRKRIAGA